METGKLRDEFRRSGGPDLSLLNRVIGQELEGPLSEKGRREADAAARELARHPVKSVWSSTMIRARETAETFSRLKGHEIRFTDDLREVRAGILSESDPTWRFISGVTRLPFVPDRAKALILGATVLPAVYFRWERGFSRGGETPGQFHERLQRAIEEIVDTHEQGDQIAVFCHGYLITYLAERVCVSGPRIRISRYVRNGSITTTDVRPDGALVLKEFAASRHLE